MAPKILSRSSFSSSSSSSSSSLSSSDDDDDLKLSFSPNFSNFLLGPVPSKSEIDFAIASLQNFVLAVTSNREEVKWVVEMLESPTSRLLVSCGLQRLYASLHLWQINPFVQRFVVSLVSDKALWDAIMSNELVRKIGKPLGLDGNGSKKEPERLSFGSEEPEFIARILQWIWESIVAKVTELVKTFQSLMNKIFERREMENLSRKDDDDEKLKHEVESSLLLAIVIILIVLVVRANCGI